MKKEEYLCRLGLGCPRPPVNSTHKVLGAGDRQAQTAAAFWQSLMVILGTQSCVQVGTKQFIHADRGAGDDRLRHQGEENAALQG